jgi:E3 ubiquitin-protein ligase SHPRH
MRLRGALEIQHMAIFFRANAYFQIKSNEEMTKADTPEFEALEKQETEGYEEAKRLRREILQEASTVPYRICTSLILTQFPISRYTGRQTSS